MEERIMGGGNVPGFPSRVIVLGRRSVIRRLGLA
jgi:hypothetical protein